jgi:serine/threonine protein kinase
MSRSEERFLPATEDPRVLQLVQEYLALLEAGQRPDRDAFLTRHPEIAAEVAECLDGLEFVHAAAPQLRPPSGPTNVDLSLAAPLGDYRIGREIGRGGMAVVYEAEQLSLGRRVALKVLPFAAAFDARHLQRFKNEAQAAAHLHHSHIVPVYAVGSERGVHFYAMQLIDGQSLAALIHQLREGRADPNSSRPAGSTPASTTALTQAAATLSTERSRGSPAFYRTIAHMGIQAAEALEHAHQEGIVHRDVKPANLLLDVRGQLWVTDFGLAQFHADAALTLTGDLVGTLRYMSPEQARLPRILDHRTDIYSLGLTLYELLTLEPAFAGTDRQELLRRIAEEEPRPPRSLDRSIPVDLETIVLKAIAKDPADRYAAAQDFAEDLKRFLTDQPIRARRPSMWERVIKWSRRHRSLVGAGMLSVLLAAAVLAVFTLLIARQRAAAMAALERAALEQAHAEANFEKARRAVDELFTQIGEEPLRDNPRLKDSRRQLLEAALAFYQAFIDQARDAPAQQAELAAVRTRMARIIAELAAPQGGSEKMFQALLLTEKAVQDDLGLTRDQVARLNERFDKLWQPLREFDKRGPGAEKAIADILHPQQAQRLWQIALQLSGAQAFSNPGVTEKLQLTAEQREKIRAIQDDVRLRRTDELREKERARILGVLTPEQKAKWQEMTGEPFKGSLQVVPPGGETP